MVAVGRGRALSSSGAAYVARHCRPMAPALSQPGPTGAGLVQGIRLRPGEGAATP
jgi:hypothetical protein